MNIGLLALLGLGFASSGAAANHEFAEIYTRLRNRAYTTEPADLGLAPAADEVWGVVMEIGYPEAVVTLLALAEGTVSIYFSDGGGIIGLGMHPGPQREAKEFLAMAQAQAGHAMPSDAHPVPRRGYVRFSFRTGAGLRSLEVRERGLMDGTHLLAPFYHKGHELIAEIRAVDERNSEPRNDLERSMVKAAKEPAHRPQFYCDLAKSDIYVIVADGAPPGESGRTVLRAGKQLAVRDMEYGGKRCIPIFSSLSWLKAAAPAGAPHIVINALEFLKMTLGAPLVLNPGATYGKEITPQEAQQIVDGSAGSPARTMVVPKDREVLLGEPTVYPQELVDALKQLFANDKRVKRAWIAHFLDSGQGPQPHTLLAIEVTGDFDAVSVDVGRVIWSVNIPEPPLDVIQIGSGIGFDRHFLKRIRPFYVRRRFGLF